MSHVEPSYAASNRALIFLNVITVAVYSAHPDALLLHEIEQNTSSVIYAQTLFSVTYKLQILLKSEETRDNSLGWRIVINNIR